MEITAGYIGRILRVTVLGIAVFGTALFITAGTAALFGKAVFETPWIAATVQLSLLLIISLILIGILSKGDIRQFGLRFGLPGNYRSFIWPIGLGIVLGLISTALLSMLGNDFIHPAAEMTVFQMILIAWVLAPIAEEIFVRGLLQGMLERLNPKGAVRPLFSLPVIYGAFLFGLMHLVMLLNGAGWEYTLVICSFAFAVGILAGYWRAKTGNLFPAILAHSFANVGGSIGAVIVKVIGG